MRRRIFQYVDLATKPHFSGGEWCYRVIDEIVTEGGIYAADIMFSMRNGYWPELHKLTAARFMGYTEDKDESEVMHPPGFADLALVADKQIAEVRKHRRGQKKRRRTRAKIEHYNELPPRVLLKAWRHEEHRRPNGELMSAKEAMAVVYADESGHLTCCYCGRKMTVKEFTIEHLTPKARGGKTVPENILPACLECNTTRPCFDIREKFVNPVG